ncbi:hypothetical protein AMTR_s00120p00047460 [Amborella trichopoda]|uniref:Uncharacterized protein n=1 Tax=Amborella trichopoda TaxID=13333 RepID=W1NTS7_AMBTC|nr:hypothetical protein AMTR_s00120p00047460 [Amborella trichopoda]
MKGRGREMRMREGEKLCPRLSIGPLMGKSETRVEGREMKGERDERGGEIVLSQRLGRLARAREARERRVEGAREKRTGSMAGPSARG